MQHSEAVLTLPALGQDVQLGMLYDARTSQLFAGVSLWNNRDVNANQEISESQVQNTDFKYSKSLEEARSHVGLDVEGSLSLDLGLLRATGSAKYLSDKKSSTFEARVDVSCTVARRTRRIPQETLACIPEPNEDRLKDSRFTHFVAEVVEGGSATLSFVRTCKSAEEMKEVVGKLEVKLKSLPVGGRAKLDYKDEEKSMFEHVKVSYSGAMAENVANIEDTCRVAREMPTKLAQQMNALSFKLLPLSILDNGVRRQIRELDANLVTKTAAALKAGAAIRLKLDDLQQQGVIDDTFPVIKKQVANLLDAFVAADTEFTQAARHLLPELRDGTTDYSAKIAELQKAVTLFEQRTRIAETFVSKKLKEAYVLRTTTGTLLAGGFENYLVGGLPATSLIGNGAPRLLLSFGGAGISRAHHPLQKDIESSEISASEHDDDDDDDNDDGEWFEDQQTVANVTVACTALHQLRTRLRSCGEAAPAVTFGVANIDKACRPGEKKRSKTRIGDIVLDHDGKMIVVTGMLPAAPAVPTLHVTGQSIVVSLPQQERDNVEELVIPTTGFVVRFRPRPNTAKDGAFPRAMENEAFKELHLSIAATAATSTDTSSSALLNELYDNCDYEVGLCVETIVGPSAWSASKTVRTEKLPSTASKLIEFYFDNRYKLSRRENNTKPWELTSDSQTLYLGYTIVAERNCTDPRFEDELALRIVDVAAEFRPEVLADDIKDSEKTKLVVFAGPSGHGKSTQINAFLSYLLGGELDDAARIMVIDDRGANQAHSVTKFITCYRVRPLSPLFEGKTILIVDTPGFGDAEGVERDMFITAAMSEFFKTVTHVNTIIFTCRANEMRTTILSPVSTYIFSLFAKNVSGCLRTIYTFSDVGAPLARNALQELQWPVENGETEVNNAAFGVGHDNTNNPKIRDWWRISVNGQHYVREMLLRMPPVPTNASSEVTTDRLALERKCELVEKQILRTASDAQILIANLGALANAVGAAPGEKVPIKVIDAVQVPVPDGKATTLCTVCSSTCHEICAYADDADKKHCSAMRGEYCGVCKKHCHWSKHTNARFIIRAVERTDWVVSEDLIKRWNINNNTLEGALLDAMDAYLKLQEELRNNIIYLATLTEKLKNTALLHNPAALINYVESLILTARARGAPAEHLVQLTTAKNTLLLAEQVKQRGAAGATRDSQILLQVLTTVRKEMKRRKLLEPLMRAVEEEKPCNLYNKLLEELPREIQEKAPAPLKKEGRLSKGARYPENLQAIVMLVQLVLTDGGVVAALQNPNKKKSSKTAVVIWHPNRAVLCEK